jgi:hypothetical protein
MPNRPEQNKPMQNTKEQTIVNKIAIGMRANTIKALNELRIQNAGLTKECNNCEYFTTSIANAPCDTCSIGYSKWEQRQHKVVIKAAGKTHTCSSCRYTNAPFWKEPCKSCIEQDYTMYNKV